MFNLVSINEFQRSRLTFDLPWSLILESHQHIKTTRPMEIKFQMTTPYDWLTKIYTNRYGHMTRMATAPIYGKSSLNIFFSETKRPLALGLGMCHWGVGPTRFAQMMTQG